MRGEQWVGRVARAGAMVGSLSLIALGAAGSGSAQTPPTIDPETGISSACEAVEHRQFDYWIGSWIVRDQAGNEVGRNRISRISQGCALLEEWVPPAGPMGTSINFFDRARGRWNQLWVGGGGPALRLEGGPEDGAMTLAGTRTAPNGASVTDRIRWIPMADGRVEQRWESNTGEGGAWQVVFQGFYEKEAESGNRCLVSGNGTRIEVLLDADGVGSDQMEMAEITFPGTLNPTAGHRHGSTEVLYVLEGELDHGIDGTFQRLGPGMVGVVRPGQEVIHRPRGNRPVRVLAVWTPGGEVGRIAPAFQPCSGGS